MQQVGDLTQPLTSSYSLENMLRASAGQHGRVYPINRGVGEPTLRAREGQTWYHLPHLQCSSGVEGKLPYHLQLARELTLLPPSYQLQHSGK